jgi:hypothetical protein
MSGRQKMPACFKIAARSEMAGLFCILILAARFKTEFSPA